MELNNENEIDSVLFREVQKPDRKQIFAGVIAAILILLFWYLMDSFLMIMFFLELEILFLVARYRKLVTEVREDGVYVRLNPFNSDFRSFPFSNIRSYEVKTIDPLIHCIKGTGLKDIPRPYKYAYIVSANKKGVLIELMEGNNVSKLMIGSRIPEKLENAIRKGIEKQNLL
jgi:hypothetical protein